MFCLYMGDGNALALICKGYSLSFYNFFKFSEIIKYRNSAGLKSFSIMMSARIQGAIRTENGCHLIIMHRISYIENLCIGVFFAPCTSKIALPRCMNI